MTQRFNLRSRELGVRDQWGSNRCLCAVDLQPNHLRIQMKIKPCTHLLGSFLLLNECDEVSGEFNRIRAFQGPNGEIALNTRLVGHDEWKYQTHQGQ